jgi:hypothetical protein
VVRCEARGKHHVNIPKRLQTHLVFDLALNQAHFRRVIPTPFDPVVSSQNPFRRKSGDVKPLRVGIDLDNIKPGPAIELLRYMAGQVKDVEILVSGGNSDAWPDGPHWPTVQHVEIRGSDLNDTHAYVSHDGRWTGLYGIDLTRHSYDLTALISADDVSKVRPRLLSSAAVCAVADIGITDYPLVLGDKWFRDAGALCPEDALAVIGLWLRTFRVARLRTVEGFMATTSIDWMNFIATRTQLPAAWSFPPDRAALTKEKRDQLLNLSLAPIVRMARSLRARDAVHSLLWRGLDGSKVDEVLYHVDVFLLMVSAAYDALARTVHLTEGLPGDLRSASWRSKKWINDLKAVRSDAWGLVKQGTDSYALIKVIAILRNTIHQEPLHGVLQLGRAASVEVEVPNDLASELTTAAAQFGFATAGLSERNGQWHVAPGTLIECLTARIFPSLNSIMAVLGTGTTQSKKPINDPHDQDFGMAPAGSASLFLGLPFPEFEEIDPLPFPVIGSEVE